MKILEKINTSGKVVNVQIVTKPEMNNTIGMAVNALFVVKLETIINGK
ncbi:MAG: hypothetical protein IPF68_11425 [Bacteroidales bacterium]|nr:hypothetical protein [Bacteroidales bacterium]